MAAGLGQNPGTRSSLTFHSRPSFFFSCDTLLYLALRMDEQLRSADSEQLLPAKNLRHPASKCHLVSRRISHCPLSTHEAAENLGRELSNDHVDQSYKNVEENLFFSLNSRELSHVPRRNCTIILKLFTFANQISLCPEVQCHFLLAVHPLLPFFNCTRIIPRATHTSFHGVQLYRVFRRQIADDGHHDYHATSGESRRLR